jgi:hypothetical protein
MLVHPLGDYSTVMSKAIALIAASTALSTTMMQVAETIRRGMR